MMTSVAQLAPVVKPIVVGGARPSPAGTPLETARRLTGNSGNLAFSVAVAQSLLGGKAPVFGLNNNGQAAAQGNIAVLPCANYLSGDEHEAMTKRAAVIDALDMPVVAIGLGAQAPMGGGPCELSPDVRQFVEAVVRHRPGEAPHISVRGEFTRQVMEKAGFGAHVEVLGCPSLFLNTAPDLGEQVQRRFEGGIERVAVSGWSRSIPAALESRLSALATETKGLYVVQNPKGLAMLAAGQAGDIPERMLKRFRHVLTPGLDDAASDAWAATHARVYFNLDDWMAALRTCDFFVGGRIHGTMLAIQAGVPAVCLVHDTRTLEMCQLMGLPHIPVHEAQNHPLTKDQLRRWFKFDAAAFNRNRLALGRRTVAFLARNGLTDPDTPLARFVAEACADRA